MALSMPAYFLHCNCAHPLFLFNFSTPPISSDHLDVPPIRPPRSSASSPAIHSHSTPFATPLPDQKFSFIIKRLHVRTGRGRLYAFSRQRFCEGSPGDGSVIRHENSLIVRLVTRDSPVSIEKTASNREKRKQRCILCE